MAVAPWLPYYPPGRLDLIPELGAPAPGRGREEAEFLADINRAVYEAMLAEMEEDERR